MAYQIYDYGKTVAELQKNGQSTSRQEVPVGAFHDDGDSKHRWAFLKEASVVTAGKIVYAASYVNSAAALSGTHFASTSEFWGVAGSRAIRINNASLLSIPLRYENGTFEVLSGAGAPFNIKIESVEIGVAGGRSILTLQGELPVTMSTAHSVEVRPNKYYGVKLTNVAAGSGAGLELIAGVTTTSGITSGYQLLITKGLGMGFQSTDINPGLLVGAGVSGVFVSGHPHGFSGYATAIGRLVSTGNVAKKFCSVDWFIE